MNHTYIASGVAFVILAIALWYAIANYPEVRGLQPVFVAQGHLVKDNPGLTPGVWYLVYEEPGFAALSVPLSFDTTSRCGVENAFEACTGLLQGDHVRVEGSRREGRPVLVKEIVFMNPKERNIPIRLFYYDPKKDTDENGNLLCGARGLVAVPRVLPYTTMPLTEAIKLLLRGDISDAERAAGVTSEFPMIGVRLEKAVIENSIATLTFSDEQGKTSGGSCRVGILGAQIEATTKQFPTVKEVKFEPEELFQP